MHLRIFSLLVYHCGGKQTLKRIIEKDYLEKLILGDIRKKLDNTVGKIDKKKKISKREPTPE